MYDLAIIRALCKKKGMHLQDLAGAIGMTPQGLQNLIKQNTTKPVTLQKIANVLNVDVSIFLAKKDKNSTDNLSEPLSDYNNYKEKYIRLLEEYNNLLKERIKNKECKPTQPDKNDSRE